MRLLIVLWVAWCALHSLLIAGAVFAVSLIAPKVPGTAGHCTQRRGCQIRSGPGLDLPEPLLFQQVVRPDL